MAMFNAPVMPETDQGFNLEEYVPFDSKTYSVTDYVESICGLVWCPCQGWLSKTLYLDDQESTLKIRNLCGTRVQRRPYAQLGSVEKHKRCMVCFTIGSDLAPATEEDGNGGLSPGFGCDEAYMDQIIKDLQERKEKRGSIAQIKKLEFMHDTVMKIATQVPIILDRLGVEYKPQVSPLPEPRQVFPERRYDVSNYAEMLCSGTFRELLLGPEEAHLTVNGCCGMSSVTQKREYAQLGSVEAVKTCFCCRAVTTDMGPISPGLGCDTALTAEIATEMKARMSQRGDVGQIVKQEKMLRQLAELSKSMPLLNEKVGTAYPPSQETMARLYGPSPPTLPEEPAPAEEDEAQQVQSKAYDITNHVESLCGCCCTCGVAGLTSQKLELHDNDVTITTKSNLVDSEVKLAYAQLGSVDFSRSCCCCYRVNDFSPGWGCDKALVEEIAEELQQRKVKRGNIAQIRQLEVMERTAAELDVRAGLVVDREGIEYPPTMETMGSLFPSPPPRVVKAQEAAPHFRPAAKFEDKLYGTTNYVSSCCGLLFCPCAGWTSRSIRLEAEEAHFVVENLCSRSAERVPYAQLGSVETETECCCCIGLPEVASPGFGCSKDLVDEIAGELQERKVKRGNIAQLKMQENMIDGLLRLSTKMDLYMERMGLAYPPDQDTMSRVFGGGAAAPAAAEAPAAAPAGRAAAQVPGGAVPEVVL